MNIDLPPSELSELRDLREKLIGVPYHAISDEDKQKINAYLEDKCEMSKCGVWSTTKATAQDVTKTGSRVGQEVSPSH